VELDGLHQTALAEQAGHPVREAAFFCLDIEINERAGLVRVHDPRLFQAGQHMFCKRLLAAASEQQEIRRAEVNLATATCWIEFGPGLSTSQALASAFIEAVRQASTETRNKVRRFWWQRVKDSFRRKRYRRSNSLAPCEALALEPGRIEIDVQGLTVDHDQILRLTESLTGLEAVEGCVVLSSASRIAITAPGVASGVKRLEYLMLAGGSFALTVLGLIVPGIPTVPFLLATSYYLARSSPRLDEKLRGTVFLGPILQEWEQSGGLSRRSKDKLIGLSGLIVVVAVVLSPLSPLTTAVIVVLWLLSITWIKRLPDLSTGNSVRLRSHAATPLAIAAS
jgi:uncharacterized membrane protein YbaN (DUF454 family)